MVRDGQALVQDEVQRRPSMTLAPVDGDTDGGWTCVPTGRQDRAVGRAGFAQPGDRGRHDLRGPGSTQNTALPWLSSCVSTGGTPRPDPGFPDQKLVDALAGRYAVGWSSLASSAGGRSGTGCYNAKPVERRHRADFRPGGSRKRRHMPPHLAETVGAVADALRHDPVHALDTRPLFGAGDRGLGRGPTSSCTHRHGTDAIACRGVAPPWM